MSVTYSTATNDVGGQKVGALRESMYRVALPLGIQIAVIDALIEAIKSAIFGDANP